MGERRFLTTGQLARHFAVPEWQIDQLFRRQLLPPPDRAGHLRIVMREDLPRVRAALVQAGYLRAEVEQPQEVTP